MAYQFFAVSPRTLEPVLADELKGLGAKQVKVGAGGVAFEGTLETAMAVCLHSRIASRVLMRIATRQYYDSHDSH